MNASFIKSCFLTGTLSLVFCGASFAQPQMPAQTQNTSPVKLNLPIAEGKFQPNKQSLQQYQYPDWFRDAKLGFWSHWGPQAVPRQGDWYAKNMYMEGSAQYKYHVANYGHPSIFGYKDIIPLWKAERWDPEALMKLYKKVGAKYFVSMATHHDNFFLWNSRLNKWNAVNMGPKKDVVGLWQKAAKIEGLKFGVSEHLAASFTWFQTSRGADKEGPLAGVPYDGASNYYNDLYHGPTLPGDGGWLTNNPVFQQEWFNSIKELIDMYQPDLLYSDSQLPFGRTGLIVGQSLLAHFYNQDMTKNKGKLLAVYNCKQGSDGQWAEDVERNVKSDISPFPWQTDTSIGDWYYKTGQKYKTSVEILQMLVDIVSKNGNLLINVVQTPEGDLEPDVLQILDEIGSWMDVNGEGIYGSRPWKVFGDKDPGIVAGTSRWGENDLKYTEREIRYTTKGETLYAFCLNIPTQDIQMASLAKGSKLLEKPIKSISLVGSSEKVQWKQEDGALVIAKPSKIPVGSILEYKIKF